VKISTSCNEYRGEITGKRDYSLAKDVLRFGAIVMVSMFPLSSAFGQLSSGRDAWATAQSMQHSEKLQQVITEKAAYAAAIVSRWEEAARASGKFDEGYTNDLYIALMKLQPENLLAAGEAPSYAALQAILANGPRAGSGLSGTNPEAVSPQFLGDVADDLVYTPVAPCRIVDTRNAGGAIAANTSRAFDVDGSTFVGQGGVNSSCGIPFGVARAVAMTIHSVSPAALGSFLAWPVGGVQPVASVLNFSAGQVVANTTIVPVLPGTGSDFWLRSTVASQAVVDVVGYFAAPVSTALQCTTVASAPVAAAVNVWTAVDAACPAGTSATGGGYDTPEGSLGYPGVWLTSLPNGNGWRTWVDNQTNGPRHTLTYARCCRVPGR